MGSPILNASLDVETSMAPRLYPWRTGAYLSKVGITREGPGGGHRSWTIVHDEETIPRPRADIVHEIQEYLAPVGRIIGHNLKFDLIWIKQALGIDPAPHVRLYCTMVGEYMLAGQQLQDGLSLDSCCERRGLPMKDDRVRVFWEDGVDTRAIPLSILDEYLEQDCALPLQLFHIHESELRDRPALARLVAVHMHLLRDLAHMECAGIRVDRTAMEKLGKEYTARVEKIDAELHTLLGDTINPNSGPELSAALYGGTIKRDSLEWVFREFKKYIKLYSRKCVKQVQIKGLGFKPPKGAELSRDGLWQTDRDTLQRLHARTKVQRQVKEVLLRRSEENKTRTSIIGKDGKSGLLSKIQGDGNIHGQFNQTTTITGRLSSSNPNLQNFPRAKTAPIKRAFVPRYDWLVNSDLSQLEWRIAAALSGDKMMIREIQEGVDYHAANATHIFGASPDDPDFQSVRTDAKVFGFRMIYRGSPYAFYMDSKMPDFSLRKWEQMHSAFFEKYWGLRQWQERNIALVDERGYLVNPSGRILRFKKYMRRVRGEVFEGYKPQQVVNYPVQSFATADIMPLAMQEIAKRRRKEKLRSKLIMQVHDSLVHDAV